VEAAAVFGSSIHAAGMDRAALEHATKTLGGGAMDWKEVTPQLEDVFIHLLSKPPGKPAKDAA
jgi:ABC-2 type transport system ATP-binding protein